MKKITSVIVDDESLARERIRSLLLLEKDFEIIEECKNGNEAIEAVKKNTIDVMFLDIQMPDVDGFMVIQKIKHGKMPYIIFVTAFDSFAIKAFEVNALDYILKPFDKIRFDEALNRIRDRIKTKEQELYSFNLLETLRTITEKKNYPERIAVKAERKIVLLTIKEIEWFESVANYVHVHIKNQTYIVRDTISNFESRFDPELFLRIHRSYIVNIDYVKELKMWQRDEYVVVMTDGTQLSLGPSYRKSILAKLKS